METFEKNDFFFRSISLNLFKVTIDFNNQTRASAHTPLTPISVLILKMHFQKQLSTLFPFEIKNAKLNTRKVATHLQVFIFLSLIVVSRYT